MRFPIPPAAESLGRHGFSKRQERQQSTARWLALLLCGMAWTTPLARSQDATPVQPFLDLEARFEDAFAKVNEPVSKLNSSYVDALNRLLSSETAAGKLEAALHVKTEIDGFGDGSDFNAATFQKRGTEHPAVAGMRTKYLAERQRLRGAGKRSRTELVKNYQTALVALEQEQTRLGNLDAALAARNARSTIEQDPRFQEDDQAGSGSFRGRVHIVAKGEVELRYNGTKLSFRNISPTRNKYVDGTSEVVEFQSGGILVVKMRATAVYRALIVCLESEDGSLSIPVALDDYRYLGPSLADKDLNLDAERFAEVEMRPGSGTADADMAAMWNGKPISAQSRAGSEWIQSGPGVEWHSYAVRIPDAVPQLAASE